MAPSAQQEPTENSNSTVIERALSEARFRKSVEQKNAAGTPLSDEEINGLYELDTPLHARQWSQWPDYFYQEDDPELAKKLVWYSEQQRLAMETSVKRVTETHGDDAQWLLSSYGLVRTRVPELIEAGASAQLLVDNLTPADHIRYFDFFNESGIPLDASKVFAAYQEKGVHSGLPVETFWEFIEAHEEAVLRTRHGANFVVGRKREKLAGEDSIAEATRLLSIGTDGGAVLSSIPDEIVEERFKELRTAGFTGESLMSRCSPEYQFENFDIFYEIDAERLKKIYPKLSRFSKSQADFIRMLHKKGEPVEEFLSGLAGGMHPSYKPQLEALLESGVSIHTIVDAFVGEDQSLIHMYADWLMQNGADPEAIKSKFSPEGIISIRKALRDAGIPIDLNDYIGEVSAETVLSRRFDLSTENNLDIDYSAQLDRLEGELSGKQAVDFMHAGVAPAKVFERIATGSVFNEYLLEQFIGAGIDKDTVWAKASKAMKEASVWRAILTESSTDAEFAEAFRALPVGEVRGIYEDVLRRPALINLLVDRLAEKGAGIDDLMHTLIEHGADATYVVSKVSQGSWRVYNAAGWLLERGADAALVFGHIKDSYKSVELLAEFIKAGVSMAEISDSLKSDYVSQHFNELLAIGLGARSLTTQAMLKPSASFVIGNVPMLREHGYTADQLSALIEPRQVVDNIKIFMLEGLSPALAITYVMQVNRYPQQAAEEYIARQLDTAA